MRSYILQLFIAKNVVDRYKIILNAISSDAKKCHNAVMIF